MKFSMLTIAGALASANAASFRGDAAAALKKMAVMQKLTDAANKKAFGAMRKLQDENQNYNYGDQELTAETIIQPYVCTTATVYGVNGQGGEGGEQNQNAYNGYSAKPTISYLSFAAVSDADNNGYEYLYGENDEYITTLAAYLQAIGTSYCEERANLCEDCENMQNFCNMSDEERQYFAEMSEEDFQAYLEEVEQEYHNKQQQQNNQANQAMQQDENNAYAAYAYGNGGRRNLFESIQTLCGTCQQMCVNNDNADDTAKYYEEMEKLFEESMCTEAGDGTHYIGHTCGSDGRTIELAMFTDQNCMYLAGEQNAYSLYQQAVYQSYGNGDADGDGMQDYEWSNNDLAYGYMNMVTEMFDSEFSCAMGAVRTYDGSEPSEACENLYDNAISKTQCQYGNNNQQQQQNQEGGQNYGYSVPEGYDMYYSEDIENVCQSVLQLEANLLAQGSNPFSGASFKQLFGKAGLSGGAIAGIVIAVFAVIGAAAFAITKSKSKKTDLEEPVFQGGALG